MHIFNDICKLGDELRRITKRIVIDVKVDIFSEHVGFFYIFFYKFKY